MNVCESWLNYMKHQQSYSFISGSDCEFYAKYWLMLQFFTKLKKFYAQDILLKYFYTQ
jgi:hypothetical protein